jgi:hypothetical protein
MQPFTANNNRPPNQPNIRPNNLSPATQPIQNHKNDCRATTKKLALFNNRIAAQDHPSDQFHPLLQTTDALQTITMLQDKIPAHPMQQILHATTVED